MGLSSWRHRWGAAVASLGLTSALLALTSAGAPTGAAVPTPGPDQAVVTVYISDVRTGATSIGPLSGATYGLFRTRPADSTVGSDGFTSATPDYTCVSDADGDCSFTVPIGAGTGTVPQGTRLWLAAVDGPAGYYANPYWNTAPLTGGTKINNRLLWPTPALVAGQTYRSGSTWVTDPGLSAPSGSPEASQGDYTRRVASDGTVGLSRVDPALPSQCGLNVALVADLSSSMAGSVPALKNAMTTFVDALRGTPSQAALFTFGTDSPANGYPANTGLQSVATTADANRVKAQFQAWNNNPPTNYTNWDRGLAAVAGANAGAGSPSHFDLVVFITDGSPTVYGPNPQPPAFGNQGTGYTRFRELDNARTSANLVKSQGSRVLAVGVGAGVSGSGAAYNLQTISGPVGYSGRDAADADYLQTTDFTTVGQALRSVVLSACAPSISVVKRIIPNGGTLADAYTPTDPWQFTSNSLTPPDAITPASATTDAQTGATNFDVTLAGDGPGTFQIAETQKPGYSLYPINAGGTAAGTQDASCVDKSSGSDVTVPVTNSGSTGFTVDVGIDSVISCVVYNQAPDLTEASVLVHKRWRVITAAGTQDYANGAQPPGFKSQLSLSGPGTAGSTPQGWDEERSGYSASTDSPVNVSESVALTPPDCAVTGVTVEDGSPSATAPGSGEQLPTTAPSVDKALASGRNEWTLTNVVTCHSYLTLHKVVASGPADPTMWTLDAIGPSGALPGPHGRDGSDAVTRVEVTPNVDYQLAETPDAAPEYLSHYVETDVRSRPLQYPQSTGSWSCQVVGGRTPRLAYGNEGGISVPLGVHMECSTTNNTATLILEKVVQGGTAQSSDFTFHVTPLDPVLPGGHAHDVPGAPPPDGNTITIRPDQHYRITETGPPGYQLVTSRSACFTSQAVLNRNDFALLPGATGACQIVNRALSQLTVRKVDATTGEPLPRAGFDLVRDSNGNGTYQAATDTVVGSCTTAATGECSVGSLDFGTYFWVETTAPPGYQRPSGTVGEPIVIDQTNAGTTLATTEVRDSQVLTSLSVIKVDRPGGSPLAGAVFQLYRVSDGAEPGDEPDPGDEPVGEPCTTPADGTCTVGQLPFGDYYWYEVAAPAGHTLPADRTSPLATLNAADAGTDIPAYQFTNPRLPGSAAARKLDANDDAVLAGGTFDLYQDDGDGSYDDGDQLMGQCTTNADGTCELEDLDFGTYFWVETSPPIGYDLPTPTVGDPIVIDAGNVSDTQERVFRDARQSSRLVARKVDASDGSPLAGARFELYRDADGDGAAGVTDTAADPDDSVAGTCTTDASGRCSVGSLDFGDYYWFEAAPPAGYAPPDDRTGPLTIVNAATAGTELPVAVFRDHRAEWTVTKVSDPPSGSQVQPGDVITYTLTARQVGSTAARGVRITDDLGDVLHHATLVTGSIRADTGSASLSGTRLRWQIRTLAGSVTLSYRVRVDADAWGTTLRNAVSSPDPGSGGVDCDSLAGAGVSVAGDCDETVHTTTTREQAGGPPPGPTNVLPDTGGPGLWIAPLGALLVVAGGTLLVGARRHGRRNPVGMRRGR